ncbi:MULTISPECIES: ABC transporter permease DevC [unclassified Synechococcus]|uniref:ABC transporter permease DevC n=1 Tax=unclassified Synechococcus TaxID=2626047 RepID=UPI0021A961BC|nr:MULTISPECIES: ABC transporter permease DevC [unclassified Synechococcus]MCT0214086.1 ABC transporter permease DevC [Synechococcus sp. CS-1326]MCT0233861.1 ABC transporter permease DevC [Synechococcus sp. CS-1327]
MISPLRKLLKRTPVAWLQVTNNPVKMMIALAGVSFSNLLMFFQLGLLDSLYNSQRKPIDRLRADLVMVSEGYSNFASLQTFQRSRLYQALGVEGVESISPLRISRGVWITPATRQSYDIYTFGVDLTKPSLAFPELENDPFRLQPLRSAFFDRNSKKQYGDVAGVVKRDGVYPLEINGKSIRIIDTFSMGATFAAEANLIVSENTFLYMFPKADQRMIQLGLIRLRPGSSASAVQAALQPLMAKDVKVLTRTQLAELEVNYWKRNSSVGFIFSLGVLVGFVVGSIIVYQILFGDVMNNLPQYATLKAMGYTDSFVISVVIQQSAILAVIGFVPGVIISMGLYSLLANVTKLTVFMTVNRALQVLILTFVMCVGSGALATRKLVELDPADVF